MRSFFIYLLALHCVFNACAFDRCDKVVRKMHSFEEDRSVSWFSDEEVRRSSLRGSHSSPDAIPGGSVDGVEGYGQCVVGKDENGDAVQLESDRQFYDECVNIEFVLPE